MVAAIVSAGAVSGLAVRFWRYRPKGALAWKNVATGVISASVLSYALPPNVNWFTAYATAYFAAQSMGYGEHIKGLKEKAKNFVK